MSELVAVFQGRMSANVGVLEPTLTDLELPVGGSLSELVSSDCILVIGADPLTDHRVLAYHIKSARKKGAQVILVAEGTNEMSRFADQRFSPQDLPKAIKMIQGCLSPTVVYGVGIGKKDAEKLAVLKRKVFIPVFSGDQWLSCQESSAAFRHEQQSSGGRSASGDKKPRVVKRAQEAKFLVVHTSYHGPITEKAHVVLPSLLWYEQEGSTYNLEGKKVPVRRAVPLPEGLIPENEIFTQLAARL
jgi:predicted molibdopterin-dependent oxidoreductase YjgC